MTGEYEEDFATSLWTEVNIKTGANILGDVFGGGAEGLVKCGVVVNMLGGSVENDVYGGGALTHTNFSNWDYNSRTHTWGTTWASGKTSATYTTAVNLRGGTIGRNVYGGGLGNANTRAKVYGNVLVQLNGNEGNDGDATYSDNCVVKGNIFGCNNVNGTPKGNVTVHIFKTQGWTGHTRTPQANLLNKDATHTYELQAVYGGGNQAAYLPADSHVETITNNAGTLTIADSYNTTGTTTTNVIIDGCQNTSIEYVYGGGNAASAPGTLVTVNSCYEIGTLFAGGNGAGEGNPGANVGYLTGGTTAYGSGECLAVLHVGVID